MKFYVQLALATACLILMGIGIRTLFESEPTAPVKMGVAVLPATQGPNVNSPQEQAEVVFDVEPAPLSYTDAGTFGDGAVAPLAWTPASANRVPKKILLTPTSGSGTPTWQTVCVDLVGQNGTAGSVDQCIPLATNVWHALAVSRIYLQGDSGTVYVGY